MLLDKGEIFSFYPGIKLLKVNKEGDVSRNAQRSWLIKGAPTAPLHESCYAFETLEMVSL